MGAETKFNSSEKILLAPKVQEESVTEYTWKQFFQENYPVEILSIFEIFPVF